jgi:hypothetical protein
MFFVSGSISINFTIANAIVDQSIQDLLHSTIIFVVFWAYIYLKSSNYSLKGNKKDAYARKFHLRYGFILVLNWFMGFMIIGVNSAYAVVFAFCGKRPISEWPQLLIPEWLQFLFSYYSPIYWFALSLVTWGACHSAFSRK